MTSYDKNIKAIQAQLAILEQLAYGTVTMRMDVHDRSVRTIVFEITKNIKYSGKDGEEPLKDIIARIHKSMEKQDTGDINIKVTMKKGVICTISFDNIIKYTI